MDTLALQNAMTNLIYEARRVGLHDIADRLTELSEKVPERNYNPDPFLRITSPFLGPNA